MMYLPAESHIDDSIFCPSVFIETNIVDTYTLLEATHVYWNKLDHLHRQLFRFYHIIN